MKPYYEEEGIQIYNADCLEVLPSLEKVDLCLTDPPYGVTNCEWDSIIPLELLWKQLKQIIKSNGAIILTAIQPFTTILISTNIKMFRYEWLWCKNQPSNPAVANKRPMRWHENILIFYEKQPIYNPQFTDCSLSTKLRWKNGQENKNQKEWTKNGHFKYTKNPIIQYQIKPKSYIYFNVVSRAMGTFHPTQKPVELMEYLIKTYTNENELVLDFAMGSGTTLCACKKLNRRCIGIEISKEYCDIAIKRLKNTQKDMFL